MLGFVDGVLDSVIDGSELPVTVGTTEGLLDGLVVLGEVDGVLDSVIDGSELSAIVGNVDGLPETATLGEELFVLTLARSTCGICGHISYHGHGPSGFCR